MRRRKGRKKREKGVKRDGKKDGQYAFFRSMQARFKCDAKIDGKRMKSDGKRGGKKGKKVKKWRKER
jgi:hypothetical protein